MKNTVCGCVLAISLFLVLGIVGGIEQGQSVANMLWCIPLFIVMWASGRIGGFIN